MHVRFFKKKKKNTLIQLFINKKAATKWKNLLEYLMPFL